MIGVYELQDCHDCGAKPGEIHAAGCDVECCSVCGGQRISCGCDDFEDDNATLKVRRHDPAFARWTGFWPGKLEAEALGIDLNEFYARGYHKTFFVKPKVNS